MTDHLKKTWYRPDIDGLRAVAVVAVILFHANVPGFSGGFVGVDIFFVISGFLITSIIVKQLKQGTFSFAHFWERRIRRIVPVLTVVLLSTAAVGYWLILFPLDYLDFGQSLLAQSLFLSNIFFLRKSDYFAGPAEESPLLHTWSLAIEEQFYVLFPILLFLAWKLGRRFVLMFFGVCLLASLVWNYYLLLAPDAAFSIPFLPPIWAAANNATAAFYLLPARAFELLIGALLALLAVKVKKATHAYFVAGLGVSLILGSIFLYSDETVFPGLSALLPTLGTAFLIMAHTNHKTILKKVLSAPVVVWVGLLSYSLYLWHWPVLVLGKYYFGSEILSGLQIFGLLGLTLSLSVLSYHFVETPFRIGWKQVSTWKVYAAGFVSLCVLLLIGYAIMSNKGLPGRAPDAAQLIALAATDFGPDRTRCFVESRPCEFGPEEKPVTHVVLGDSHGGALLPAFSRLADNNKIKIKTYLSPGCSPLTPVAVKVEKSTCDKTHKAALEQITDGEVASVLLVSRWSNYKEYSESQGKAIAEFEQQLIETVTVIKASNVELFVLLQVPHHTYFETRSAFYEAVEVGRMPSYYLLKKDHDIFQADVYKLLKRFEERGDITIIDPADVLCNETQCDFVRDGEILYMDSNHLNRTGALELAPIMDPFINSTD